MDGHLSKSMCRRVVIKALFCHDAIHGMAVLWSSGCDNGQ